MSTTITVRVFPVVDQLIFRLIPAGDPEPEVPMHTMQLKKGTQERFAKEGDPEWEPYLRRHAKWETQKQQFDIDARLVAAMGDSKQQPEFDWPELPIKVEDLPFFQRLAIQAGNLEFPEDPIRQLALWFRSFIAPSQDDVASILEAANLIGGMDPALVDSFRQRVQRDIQAGLLGGTTVPTDEVQPVLPDGEGGAQGGDA